MSSKTPKPKARPRVTNAFLKWAIKVTEPEPPETGHLDAAVIERLTTPNSGMSIEERQPALDHLGICSTCWAKVANVLDKKIPRIPAVNHH